MADKELSFEVLEEVDNIKFPIFDVSLTKKMSPNKKEGNYVSIKSPDWVSAIVETVGGNFIVVSQYRHGVNNVLTEFPCGIVEDGDPECVKYSNEELNQSIWDYIQEFQE